MQEQHVRYTTPVTLVVFEIRTLRIAHSDLRFQHVHYNETYSARRLQILSLHHPLHFLHAESSPHHPPNDHYVTGQGSSPVSHLVWSSHQMTKAYQCQTSRSRLAVPKRKCEQRR